MSSKLFVLIASSDLLTNSYPALHILYFCLAPNIDLSIQVDYTREVEPLFKQYVIPSLFTCFFGCLSQAFTAVLAVTRMVAIFKPFFHIPKWVPFTYLLGFAILMLINEVMYTFLHFFRLTKLLVDVIQGTSIFCLSLNISHCILGLLASFFTMLKISLRKQVQQIRAPSNSNSIIFLMNAPYLFSVVNYVLSKTLFEKYGYFFLAFVAVSCFTSMLNPLLSVILKKNLREHITRSLKKYG